MILGKIKYNIFLVSIIFLISGCFSLKNNENNSIDQSPPLGKAATKKKPVEEILKEFRGGTIDLRQGKNFRLLGNYSKEQLISTQITIRGEGKVILSSDKAISYWGKGLKVFSGFKKFKFFVVEEFSNGVSVQTKINPNDSNQLNYRLKL